MSLEHWRHIVIFGGSFDPPHLAHTALPPIAMCAIDAEGVAYIPTGRQPLKSQTPATPARHRLAMLRLALEGVPDAAIVTDEIDRAADPTNPSPSFTANTLATLRERLDPSTRLRLLIGGDQLRAFDQWHDPQRVIALAEPLVMVRPPDTRESLLESLPAGFDADDWARRLVDVPTTPISSTLVREHVAAGEPLAGLVHPAVAQYIAEHGLYGATD